jgi:hypothetical protein
MSPIGPSLHLLQHSNLLAIGNTSRPKFKLESCRTSFRRASPAEILPRSGRNFHYRTGIKTSACDSPLEPMTLMVTLADLRKSVE